MGLLKRGRQEMPAKKAEEGKAEEGKAEEGKVEEGKVKVEERREKGKFFITEEGERALPDELKEKIEEAVRKRFFRGTTRDAFDLLVELGRDEIIETLKKSELTFLEGIALSCLYAEKLSRERDMEGGYKFLEGFEKKTKEETQGEKTEGEG